MNFRNGFIKFVWWKSKEIIYVKSSLMTLWLKKVINAIHRINDRIDKIQKHRETRYHFFLYYDFFHCYNFFLWPDNFFGGGWGGLSLLSISTHLIHFHKFHPLLSTFINCYPCSYIYSMFSIFIHYHPVWSIF